MDVVRLQVVQAPESVGGGFQVQIFVNDVEMTGTGAGLGMDPYDLLIPTNTLVATTQPHTIGVARCKCGVYGCGATDVTIVQEAGLVHWDWQHEAPMNRRVTFDSDAYHREVGRAAADLRWETPERTAGRLVLSAVDHNRLAGEGLRLSWVANDPRNAGLLRASLRSDDEYQIFLTFEWNDKNPTTLASEVLSVLHDQPPSQWNATWHSIRLSELPPKLAGPSWLPRQY